LSDGRGEWGRPDSVSEIEFRTLYVVAERWILGCILRFMHAKNHFSDTLLICAVFLHNTNKSRGSGRPSFPSRIRPSLIPLIPLIPLSFP
jgi:hypothetical protein